MEATEHDQIAANRDLTPERAFRVVPAASPYKDDTIDLTYLFWAWVKWSWLAVLAALVGAYLGYRDLQTFVPQAVATMTVQPSQGGGGTMPQSGLGSSAAQFGIQLAQPAATVSPFEHFKLALGSMELAGRLQAKYGLLQRIYASSWDATRQAWIHPSGPDFEREERRRAMLRQNLWSEPNLESLAQYVSGRVRIEQAQVTGFSEISVTHTDPQYAVWLLTTAFEEADLLLREKERQQSADRRRFIEQQMESRTMLYMQDTLRSLLAQELNKEVTLAADVSYAATVVEPPHLLNNRTEPNLPVTFGLPIVIAAVGALMLITLIAVIRGERRR